MLQKLKIVGGDDDRRSQMMQFDEQSQQTARKARIDIARRLVRQQQFGADDQRARDRRALFLPARKHDGEACIRSPSPTQRRSSMTSAR